MLLISQPAFQKRDHFHRFGLHTGSSRAAYPTSQGKQPFDASYTDRNKKKNKGDIVYNWVYIALCTVARHLEIREIFTCLVYVKIMFI